MISPGEVAAASVNFLLIEIVLLISMQVKALLLGLKMPTQSALRGAKTIDPDEVAAAPQNFCEIVLLVSTQVKALLPGLKTPTQFALYGAKTINPDEVAAVPENF